MGDGDGSRDAWREEGRGLEWKVQDCRTGNVLGWVPQKRKGKTRENNWIREKEEQMEGI